MTVEEWRQWREELRAKVKQLEQERSAKRERRQAKRAAGGRLSTAVQTAILAIVDDEGTATDEAILTAYRAHVTAGNARPATDDFVRRQRSRLLSDGRLEPTGDTVATPAGRTAKTWRTVDPALIPRPAFLDAWVRWIGTVPSTGDTVLVIRCPYCSQRHVLHRDPGEVELQIPECGRGPIRVRFTKSILAKLEAEP